MKRILSMLVLLTFLAGCALTTIRPPARKKAAAPKKSVIEKIKEVVRIEPVPVPVPVPVPEPIVVEKFEEKEEILPEEEEEDIK